MDKWSHMLDIFIFLNIAHHYKITDWNEGNYFPDTHDAKIKQFQNICINYITSGNIFLHIYQSYN